MVNTVLAGISLNPFAIVVGGIFVVVLGALYLSYLARRSRGAVVAPVMSRRGGVLGGAGAGEEPVLVDLYAERGYRESSEEWRDIMPVAVTLIHPPTMKTLNAKTSTPMPARPPRRSFLPKIRKSHPVTPEVTEKEPEPEHVEVMAAIAMPRSHGYKGEDGEQFDYALGVVRMPWRGGMGPG